MQVPSKEENALRLRGPLTGWSGARQRGSSPTVLQVGRLEGALAGRRFNRTRGSRRRFSRASDSIAPALFLVAGLETAFQRCSSALSYRTPEPAIRRGALTAIAPQNSTARLCNRRPESHRPSQLPGPNFRSGRNARRARGILAAALTTLPGIATMPDKRSTCAGTSVAARQNLISRPLEFGGRWKLAVARWNLVAGRHFARTPLEMQPEFRVHP